MVTFSASCPRLAIPGYVVMFQGDLHLLTEMRNRWASRSTKNSGGNWSRKKASVLIVIFDESLLIPGLEEEEEESEEESEEEEEAVEPTPADGAQTPSGMETPSGMTSVVSTVAGGMETPDFLELRKGRTVSEAMESSGPKSLYQVLPEKQTSVRGLMGSERGYDVSAVAGAPIPVLGDERGTKVGVALFIFIKSRLICIDCCPLLAQGKRRGCVAGCLGAGGLVGRGASPKIRQSIKGERRCPWRAWRRLFGHGGQGDGQEETETGSGAGGQEEREGVQVLKDGVVYDTCVVYAANSRDGRWRQLFQRSHMGESDVRNSPSATVDGRVYPATHTTLAGSSSSPHPSQRPVRTGTMSQVKMFVPIPHRIPTSCSAFL